MLLSTAASFKWLTLQIKARESLLFASFRELSAKCIKDQKLIADVQIDNYCERMKQDAKATLSIHLVQP